MISESDHQPYELFPNLAFGNLPPGEVWGSRGKAPAAGGYKSPGKFPGHRPLRGREFGVVFSSKKVQIQTYQKNPQIIREGKIDRKIGFKLDRARL